jgi:hypothetical protein
MVEFGCLCIDLDLVACSSCLRYSSHFMIKCCIRASFMLRSVSWVVGLGWMCDDFCQHGLLRWLRHQLGMMGSQAAAPRMALPPCMSGTLLCSSLCSVGSGQRGDRMFCVPVYVSTTSGLFECRCSTYVYPKL